MKTIGRMLTWMILTRFIFILFGVSLFVLTLDAVTYANEILQLRGNDPTAIAYYMLLRSPGILSTFLPISVLLALLLALTELSYRNETVAMWSAGISPVRMMGMLLPARATTCASLRYSVSPAPMGARSSSTRGPTI